MEKIKNIGVNQRRVGEIRDAKFGNETKLKYNAF